MHSKCAFLFVCLLLVNTLRQTTASDEGAPDPLERRPDIENIHRLVQRSVPWGEEGAMNEEMDDTEHVLTRRSVDEDLEIDVRQTRSADDIREEAKRGPQLSINQDMQALAAGMQESQNRNDAIQSLYRLGKRRGNPDWFHWFSFTQPSRVYAKELERRRLQGSLALLKRLGKRSAPQLSINQDLMALADAVRARESSNALYRLGKRGPRLSVNSELHALADSIRGGNRYRAQNTLASLGKRGPALSVNADLQTLADSIYGNGHSQAESVSKLMRLGKRGRPLSVNADMVALADSLRSSQNAKTQDAANTLMRLGKRTPSFSFNQDMQTLAESYRNGARGAKAQSTLQRIGRAEKH